MIISTCYTSTITTDILFKKAIITPNDVAQLATVAQQSENKNEKNLKTGYTLKEMLKNIRSPYPRTCQKMKHKILIIIEIINSVELFEISTNIL